MMATAATTTKSPVLVILPPAHKCPDLGRVLGLARKAFDDLSLNIMDLNLRFAWVSGDELVKDDLPPSTPLPDDATAGAAHGLVDGSSESALAAASQEQEQVGTALPSPTPTAPVSSDDVPSVPAAADNGSRPDAVACAASASPAPPASQQAIAIPEADLSCFRVFISDLVPTLSDAEIFDMRPADMTIIGATFYPPRPLSSRRGMVRSATFAFSKAKQAKDFRAWVKQTAGAGSLDHVFVTRNVFAYFLAQGMTPEEFMSEEKRAAFLAQDSVSSSGSTNQDLPPANPNPPPATRPIDLPEAHDYFWRLIVRNVIGSLAKAEVLAAIVPQGLILAGATVRRPKALGDGRTKGAHQGRDVKLAFHSESDAVACHAWITEQEKPGGVVAELAVPRYKIYLSRPLPPTLPAPPSQSSSTLTPSNTSSVAQLSTLTLPPTNSPTAGSSSCRSPSNASSAASPSHPPSAQFRLTVGNLLHHLTSDQLFAALVPPGIIPTDMSLQPLQQISGRPETCRSIVFEFDSERDMQATHDWVRSEAAAGGRIAKLLPPNARIIVTMDRVSLGPAHPPTVSSSFANLPDASPDHFRLHVSNLNPDLDLARILPVLVPREISLAGASLFAPRPMSASRRDLARSLKLAFLTESDAKRCREWIKQDSGGANAKVAAPGAKIGVGTPMDPMSVDPQVASSVELADGDDELDSDRALRRQEDARKQPVASTTPPAESNARQFHISINGIDTSKPASTVFSTILGSLPSSVEPAQMGIRDTDGRRCVEFVFDSEAVVKQFVLQVWMAIKAGTFASITAEGGELRIGRGRSRGNGE